MEPLLVLHLGLNFGTKSSKFSTKVRILTSAGILLDRSKAGTSQASQQGRQHQREYRYVPRPFRRMHKVHQPKEDGRWKKMEEVQFAQSGCFGMLRDSPPNGLVKRLFTQDVLFCKAEAGQEGSECRCQKTQSTLW
jgi:hypothetical protein